MIMETWNAKELYELFGEYAEGGCKNGNYSPSDFHCYVQRNGSGSKAPEPLLLDFIMNGVWDENQPMVTHIEWTDELVKLYEDEYGDFDEFLDQATSSNDCGSLYVDDFYIK
jgi:hypothetical protein